MSFGKNQQLPSSPKYLHFAVTSRSINMSLSCQVVFSARGQRLLVLSGYEFCFHKTLKSGLARWKCAFKTCKSHLKTLCKDDFTVVEGSEGHNHQNEDESTIMKKDLQNNLKRKAVEDICERPSKLIHHELRTASTQDFTTSHVIQFRKAIYKARRKILPKLPSNLQELHEVLDSFDVHTEDGLNFLLKNDRQKNVIIFSNSRCIDFLSSCENIYVDGTFKCCPKYFKQMFTIHGIKNETYIPLAFALLNDKCWESYAEVFYSIKVRAVEINKVFEPKFIISDFEESIMKAASVVWPESRINGCKFHLTQCWWRRIQHL